MDQAPPAAPRNPFGPSPARRANSIRRTSTIDTVWPEGFGKPMLMTGRARDFVTPESGAAFVSNEAEVQILASAKREIISVTTTPENPAAQRLVGARAGGHSRILLGELLADERAAGTPLHMLLDDFAGASLVAGWAWSRWVDDWPKLMRERTGGRIAGKNGVMEGICIGFRPGSTALQADGAPRQDLQNNARVVPLPAPDDPIGWHEVTQQDGAVGMRRARRLDVWREGDELRMDVGFQDSATSPNGGRVAIHEYIVRASANAGTHELTMLDPEPRILPYGECPGAVGTSRRILGGKLDDMRQSVLEKLPGTLGCTHLNDVLRSLADAPALLRTLEQ